MVRTWDFFVMGESSQITTATSTYSDGNGQDFCGDMGKQAFAQSILYTGMGRIHLVWKVTDKLSVNFHDVFFFIFCQIIAKNEEKHVMEIYGWVVRNFPVVRKWTRWIRPKCVLLFRQAALFIFIGKVLRRIYALYNLYNIQTLLL